MLNFTRLKDCVVTNKNVILRLDINVPLNANQTIADDTRIKAIIPTLKYLLQNQAKVIIISHFGRPEGKRAPEMSLELLLKRLEELTGSSIAFVDDCIGEKVRKAVANINYGQAILLENLRFYKEETKNDPAFARELASLGNLYVNDAFSCCHRAHASIVGIPSILKGCAGFLLENELDNLQQLLATPKKPFMAIVGGSKVSTKIDLLNSLIAKADSIFIGGAMANTFLYALGNNIGASLCEKELKDTALAIINNAQNSGCRLILPIDAALCTKLEEGTSCQISNIKKVGDKQIIADIGPETVLQLYQEINAAQTLIWNGPIGVFEKRPFNIGTESIARLIAKNCSQGRLLAVAGGGDIISALNFAGLAGEFTYISTAGGAFLEWLEGKSLPGIAAIDSSR